MEKFDTGIIGAGPAGYSSALYACTEGKTVVLFEQEEVGGTCLNKGCIPTKAFLHIADTYSNLSGVNKLGIGCDNINFNFQKVTEYKNNVVSKLRRGLELSLTKSGVNIVRGHAEIVSKNTIRANDTDYECNKVIIATGSKPKEIQGLEFDHKFILSSDDILERQELPESILIVGSGAIGTEWSRILSAFGVEVTVVELAERLCPLADWEVSKRIERQFKIKKIKTYTSNSVKTIKNGIVTLESGDVLTPDCILVAAGRDIVKPENTFGVAVIGDASKEIMLAHYAISQAKETVLGIPFNKNIVPSVIYGNPEIAWVGAVSKSKEDDDNYKTSVFPLTALGKAHCDNSIDGFIKILSRDNKISGASIVSPEASSLIQQIVIAMTNNLTVDDIKKVCFAHPTYSEGIQESLMKL